MCAAVQQPAERPALVLDTLGKVCPVPVIELARRIGDVSVGSVIGVISDDDAAAVDIPAWCRMRRHEYLGEQAHSPGRLYLVRRLRAG